MQPRSVDEQRRIKSVLCLLNETSWHGMGQTNRNISPNIKILSLFCFSNKLKKDKDKELSMVKKGTVTEDLFLSAKEALKFLISPSTGQLSATTALPKVDPEKI